MKILLVLPSLRSGGAEKTFVTLSEGFAQRGHETSILTIEPINSLKYGKGLYETSSNVRRVSLNKSRALFAVFDLAKFIRKEKFDVVLTTVGHINILASLSKMLNLQSYPLCIRDCSMHETRIRGFKAIALHLITKFAYKNANALVCISEANKKNLADIGISNKSTRVIYNPIASDALYEKAKMPLPDDFKYLENEPFLLAVARLDPVKKHAFMLESFKKIADKIPHKLVLVGGGSLKDELYNLAKKLNIADRIVFAGYQQNPYAFISRADMLLQTSESEAASCAIMEAVSLCTPVGCVDPIGGPSEIIGTDSGFSIPTHNADEFAAKILESLSPNYFDKNAMENRSRLFAFDKSISEYLNLFESMRK